MIPIELQKLILAEFPSANFVHDSIEVYVIDKNDNPSARIFQICDNYWAEKTARLRI